MYHTQVASIKINNSGQILDYNSTALELLCVTKVQLNQDIITNIIQISALDFSELLGRVKSDNYARGLIFKNLPNQNSIVLLYAVVEKTEGGYFIKFVNWLNWINSMSTSIDASYSTINNLDYSYFRSKIKLLTEASWFKALLPLLQHIPKNFVSLISSRTFFDIMKLFSNKRNNEYSKDYNRDILSRIKNWVKKDTGISSIDIKMLVDNNSLINLMKGNQLIIRNNLLIEDVLIFPKPDKLLEGLIRSN